MKIEGKIRKILNTAIYILFVFTFFINVVLFFYESKILTEVAQKTVIKQIMNVANITAKSGDFLFLQMYMTSVLEPISDNLDIDINLISLANGRTMVSVTSSAKSLSGIYKKKTSIDFEINPVGLVRLSMTLDMSKVIYVSLLKTLLSFFTIFIGVIIFRYYINRENSKSLSPIDQFSKFVEGISPEDFYKSEIVFPESFSAGGLSHGFNRLFDTIKIISKDFAEIESNKRSLEIARRVAHDIRSPISVLNLLSSSSVVVSESERKQILNQVSDRINQIADDLLRDTKTSFKSEVVIEKLALSSNELSSVVAKVIDEKKIEAEMRKGVKVVLRNNLTENLVCGINIPAAELARIISNLVNNSIDASKYGDTVYTDLSIREPYIVIRILDFGTGIPADLLEKLKAQSISTKNNGSGIGIYSANQVLDMFGHKLDIESKLDIGTQVTISLKIE